MDGSTGQVTVGIGRCVERKPGASSQDVMADASRMQKLFTEKHRQVLGLVCQTPKPSHSFEVAFSFPRFTHFQLSECNSAPTFLEKSMSDEILNVPQAATLYCTEGSSDKVYQASLRASGDLWVVEFAYGKRGAALKTGAKTNAPVDYKTAKSVFDKLIKSKMSGGYVSDQGDVAYTRAEIGIQEKSGYLPMLPLALDDESALSLFMHDDTWYLQQKLDGENRMLIIRSGLVRGINRKGQYVDIPQDWADYLSVLPDCVICGEAVGSVFHAFDMIERHKQDLSGSSFKDRFSILEKWISMNFKWEGGTDEQKSSNRAETEKRFRIVAAFTTTESKRKKFDEIKEAGGEGVVFKNQYSDFLPGKSIVTRKFKFVESSTCLVLEINSQRSVQVGCFDESGAMVNLGNVTIPANHSIPAVDDLVEVRYLYRFEGGMLEQPVYQGPRTDLEREDAVISQITRIKRKSTSVV